MSLMLKYWIWPLSRWDQMVQWEQGWWRHPAGNKATIYTVEKCKLPKLNEGSWYAVNLHFGCKAVDLWNISLVVMLGKCHASVQIILVNQLQNCGEDTCVASRHFINVISVPHDQSLKTQQNSFTMPIQWFMQLLKNVRFHIVPTLWSWALDIWKF